MEFYGTLGTACNTREQLLELFRAGMTGARLNLSHTTLDACRNMLKEDYFPAARQAGTEHPELIIDLQGPEIRIGALTEPMTLTEGRTAVLGETGIPVPKAVLAALSAGDRIALDDSAFLLQAERVGADRALCTVLRGGVLNSRKSLAVLGVEIDAPTLTAADLENLDLAGGLGVTHILQPFVRGKEDVEILRRALLNRGLDRVEIMAKIENQRGLDHLDEIIACADQICIARGDLGNAMPLWKLPSVQKKISSRCRKAGGKPFCLVTQLLWSMEQRPVPTRAEVADIYNGVLDGASALMLTGETAVGHYPIEAMEYLVKTARCAMADMDGAEEDLS